jgi:transaldolase/glucose-6-phosphate isomerase
MDQGLRGMTSNPSIFEKAISGSADYDEDLKSLAQQGASVEEIYEALALKDIAMAADLFRPVHEETAGLDGYVSLEVSPELAHDTEGTISEARRFFEKLQRPNVMIKVPATEEGLPAITALIASGVHVNVTLLFSVDVYRDVAEAYLKGLEKLMAQGPSVAGGQKVERIASVASFFVSRVDTAVDQALEKGGHKDLQGQVAVANAKMAYRAFQEIFSGSRWDGLAAQGARVQRLLWASTGTKNPLYSDTLYVDQLIGPDTVNTMPPATLNSFLDHGTVKETLSEGMEKAEMQIRRLSGLGIDLRRVTQKLLFDGVQAFAQPFEDLMSSISKKRDRLMAGKKRRMWFLGPLEAMVDQALKRIRNEKVMNRIWAHDHTVWRDDPREIRNRLGWLHSPDVMASAVPEMTALVDTLRAEGYEKALLLGMGGSSLAPEVYGLTFGVKPGYLDLSVLDSTDPGAVLSQAESHDPAKTLYIVSTKSGGTVETLSFMKYFYNRAVQALGVEEAGKHFLAITDPGSGLESVTKELGFRKIFLNDSHMGGRYSALSYFGLVPAALIGMDLSTLLQRGATAACNSEGCNCPVGGDNESARLGAALGALADAGRDKLTLVLSPDLSAFGAWVEQLIAESTGKDGRGILPVHGEPLGGPEIYGRDRLFVDLKLEGDNSHEDKIQAIRDSGQPVVELILPDLYELGGQFFLWEMATAVAGSLLGVNPFDQPNVESAKVRAREMVAAFQKEGKLPQPVPTFQTEGMRVYGDEGAKSLEGTFRRFMAKARPGKEDALGRSYIAIQAYLEPTPETTEALQALRQELVRTYHMATTMGYGPRFLHSTGQLHKGDGGQGMFVQVTADSVRDVPIPDAAGSDGSSMGFGVLKMAQALGDRQALMDAGRHVIRFHLERDVLKGLKRLAEAVGP